MLLRFGFSPTSVRLAARARPATILKVSGRTTQWRVAGMAGMVDVLVRSNRGDVTYNMCLIVRR